MNIHSLAVNHSRPHQPSLSIPSLIAAMPGGAWGPPRNIVAAGAGAVNMLISPPRKKIAKPIEPYSVWKPPVSSPSPSARSKGSRLVSPTIVTTSTANEKSPGASYQSDDWPNTIWDVDMEPL